MMNHIVQSYQNFKEEDRLVYENSKQIEYINTIRIFKDIFEKREGLKLLDCAAGTGVYSFYFANSFDFDVTAIDITPRHIDYINQKKVAYKSLFDVKTYEMNATELSFFQSDSFDIVLCMGAFYHLINQEERNQCIEECLRVLKPDGLLAITYINRSFYGPLLMLDNPHVYDLQYVINIVNTGIIDHHSHKCPFTDMYCSTPMEMEELFSTNEFEIVDHSAIDFISVLKRDEINAMSENQFNDWCNLVYLQRHNSNFLSLSNHSLIIVRKLVK